MWWWMVVAWAAEPTVQFDDDGRLKAHVEIAAPADAVIAVLADAPRVAKWSDDVLGMEPVGAPSDDCQDYEVKTKGLWNPLTYVSRRCRTATGFRDQLVRSESFSVLESTWTVRPTDAGSEVHYEGALELSFPVPKRLLRGARRSSIVETLARLEAAATGTE